MPVLSRLSSFARRLSLPLLTRARGLPGANRTTARAAATLGSVLLGAAGGTGVVLCSASTEETASPAATGDNAAPIHSDKHGTTFSDGFVCGSWIEGLPEFTIGQIRIHKNFHTRIWVIYKQGVYDITDFLLHHPGGYERVMLAAGRDIEPFWTALPVHNQEKVCRMLESYRIGNVNYWDEHVPGGAEIAGLLRTVGLTPGEGSGSGKPGTSHPLTGQTATAEVSIASPKPEQTEQARRAAAAAMATAEQRLAIARQQHEQSQTMVAWAKSFFIPDMEAIRREAALKRAQERLEKEKEELRREAELRGEHLSEEELTKLHMSGTSRGKERTQVESDRMWEQWKKNIETKGGNMCLNEAAAIAKLEEERRARMQELTRQSLELQRQREELAKKEEQPH